VFDFGHIGALQNPYLVAAISLGGGGFFAEMAGFLHGDLGCGAKLLVGIGTAAILFATIWFYTPVPT
jgi:hypothetical protein